MSNNTNLQTTQRASSIEDRLDKGVAGTIAISPMRGIQIESMSQAMEFAKLMSLSREAVPKHLRENPGSCLALCIRGWEWSMNPFAIAEKSYVVNDKLAFEASIFQAVVTRRAPIKGRIKMEYEGDGPMRTCRVWAILSDGTDEVVEYTSPKFGAINPKNSPLWKNDPDQQLFYFSVRAFARRHFSDVMLGIYTVDEMQDSPPDSIVYTPPSKSSAQSVADAVNGKFIEQPIAPANEYEPDPTQPPDAQTGEEQGAEKLEEEAKSEPAKGNGPAPMTDLEKFIATLNETAETLGVDAPTAGNWWRGYLLANRLKGKEDKITGPQFAAALMAFSEQHKKG